VHTATLRLPEFLVKVVRHTNWLWKAVEKAMLGREPAGNEYLFVFTIS
jgi:hypothetical protein